MNIKYIGAMASAALLMAGGCTNDIEAPVAKDGKATMQVTIAFPQQNTRTTLEEVEGTNGYGALKCTWDEDDRVIVYNENGNKLGTLSIVERTNGNASATFNGELNGVENGEHNYRFFYMPGAQDSAPFSYDMSKQSGKFEDLGQYDFLSATTPVTVAGGIAYTESMGLQRTVAFVHFTVAMPEGVEYNGEEITVTTGQGNACEISAANEITVTKGDITVNSLDMYLAVLPTETPAPVSFAVTVGGLEYQGGLTDSHNWTNSEFINGGNQNGINIDFAVVKATDYTVTYVAVDKDGNAIEGAETLATVNFTDAAKAAYTVGTDAEGNELTFNVWNLLNTDTYVDGILDAEGKEVNGNEVELTADNANVEYKVVVKENVYDLVVVFDANGGVNDGDTSVTAGKLRTLPYTNGNACTSYNDSNEGKLSRTNYDFVGWSLDKNATTGDMNLAVGYTLADRASATVGADGTKTISKTVYAVWKQKNIGGEAPNVPGGGWN